MEEMAVYSQLEEQSSNVERAKFVVWVAGIGVIGLALGFGAGLAVKPTAGSLEYPCGRYEMAGGAFVPTCADGR